MDLLRSDTDEVYALSDEFLINVTSFFRDPLVYKQLQDVVLPKLFKNRQPDEQLRVWSVGCTSGEEAYSRGMLLIEQAGSFEDAPSLQIIASDLHEGSLNKAREGFYFGDIKSDVSKERLRRFFIKEDGG